MSTTLQTQREQFDANPDDARAFAALEEQLFLGGDWDSLTDAYRRRLEAPSLEKDPSARAGLLFRLGQVLEERCCDIDAAIDHYWQVAHLDPSNRAALRQLRQIHASREQWDLVLQISEIEGNLEMKPYERAAFLASMGCIWLDNIQDLDQALQCFDNALGEDPSQQDALRGRAQALQGLGQAAQAADTWESLIELQRGPDRAPSLVELARLYAEPLADPERAAELYRRALTDDPRSEEAVEALVALAEREEQWPLLADLFERRFDLASGAGRRTAIAVEAGRLHLERLEDWQMARMWLNRAIELSSDDVSVHRGFADLERRVGNGEALLESLERIVSLSRDEVTADILIEAGELHVAEGRDERALPFLQRGREGKPEDPKLLHTLSGVLSRLARHAELAEILEQRAALAGANNALRADALEDLGRLCDEQMGDADAASEAYAGAFACDPARPGVSAALERLYRKAESWSDLRDLLQIAAAQGPEAERGRACCSLGEILADRFDDVGAATRAFESALAIDADEPRALSGIARMAAESGDEDLLLRAYEREAEVTSDRDRLVELVGELDRLLCERERHEDALSWVERLTQSRPEDADGWRRAAELCEHLGRDAELIAALERVEFLASGPEQAELRLRIAVLHETHGDEEAALHWYEAAAEAQPSNRRALEGLIARYEAARRLEDVARVQRRLAEVLPADEQAACLENLARLLEDQLGDIDAAVVVLWRLVETPGRPDDTNDRLEALLERAGRFEELAQYLLEQRRGMDGDTGEARRIEIRRADVLLRQLGQIEEAAAMFQSLRERDPESEEVAEGLERALRAGSDPIALARFLSERAAQESDPERRAQRELECAVLLEEAGADTQEAVEAYRRLADDGNQPEVQHEADLRLERLLERNGAWSELRQRLERKLGSGDAILELELRDRLATLCRDRLGDRDSCIEHLEASGTLAPHRPEIWRSLAILYLECDRPRDLVRVLESELATGPDREREELLQLRIANLLLERGDDVEACGHFERVMTLNPSHSEASEFLVEHYEQTERYPDMVRLLMARLTRAHAEDPGKALSLRLRVAELHADALDDVESAIDVLEPALAAATETTLIAAPLADLYQRAGHLRDLVMVCRAASGACDSPAERATWMLRLGDALRELGGPEELAEAAEAYRAVLTERPNEAGARSALRELYRADESFESLAELLATEVEERAGADTLPLRTELAELLGGPLGRPADALDHWLVALDLDPANRTHFECAAGLAARLERHDDLFALLDARLAHASGDEAADLLERRGDLLAGPLEQPGAAIPTYREALVLDPDRGSARRSLRRVLEAEEAWPAVLDCLYMEARSGSDEERGEIFERAVEIATAHLSTDAVLPWLERLRAQKPREASVVARIGDVHRQAGRPEALLRALEDELALVDAPDRVRAIHMDRARILERDLASPGRAIAALERAREVAPDDTEIFAALDRLYAACGWVRERLEILEARLESDCFAEPRERLEWHRTVATAAATSLADAHRALPHRLRAVALSRERGVCDAPLRRELVHELAETLRASGRMDLWARAGESEIEILPGDAEGAQRELDLRRELAWTYERVLANPEGARRHLCAILDRCEQDPELLDGRHRDQAERALLDRLRADGNHVELEKRLAEFLARRAGDDARDGTPALDASDAADTWIELARLRDERLHAPTAAAAAYRAALDRRSENRSAIRGLRDVSERLADWPVVCEMLEAELRLDSVSDSNTRAALLRRLGELRWRQRSDRTGAIAAFDEALATDRTDLVALRSLSGLHREADDVPATIDHLEREIAVLGDDEPARRQTAWLEIGDLSRDRLADREAAVRAFEAAADAAPLSSDRQRQWASLYREEGSRERFVDVFAAWCDREDAAEVRSADHLELAEALRELGRAEEAVARVECAIELDPRSARAWDALADLHTDAEAHGEAASALERAAEILAGAPGASRLVRAALAVEPDDTQHALALLRRAIEFDPGCAEACAYRARTAAAVEAWDEAETAAARALDLAAGDGSESASTLDETLRFEAAMNGGDAARERQRLEAAARFYRQACQLDGDRADAQEACGEVLFALGDLPGARAALERRLALEEPSDDARRAQHLAVVGTALAAQGESDEALASFDRALEADPASGDAHAGRTRLLACGGRTDDAVAAYEAWGAAAGDDAEFALRMLAVAALEREARRFEDAEIHLREAVERCEGAAAAWVMLAEQLWEEDREQEALDAATRGLVHTRERDFRARLAWVRGRALEARGDGAEAAKAFGEVVENDRRHADAMLARARLLRERGDWQEAADDLATFATRYPEDRDATLAGIFHERARLLSGPLEDMEEAVRCYEQAVALQPSLTEAREPLARLLGLSPERWRDAAHHHRALLATDPGRLGSIRSLVEIAEHRGAGACRMTGLALLRALGCASPDELGAAPSTVPLKIAGRARMERPLCEALRVALVEVQKEVSDALEPWTGGLDAHHGSPTNFAAACRQACDELSVPGVAGLSVEDLGEVLWGIAALGLDSGTVRERTGIVAALDQGIGRWSRRRVRRAVEGLRLEDVEQLDAAAWRTELRELAVLVAMDTAGGDLRDALLALAADPTEPTQAQLDPTENITALVAASEPAHRLLATVVDRWCHEIENG